MYQNDSFFDLSPLGQIGLVGISTVLFFLVILAARALLMDRPVWLRVSGSLVIFWLFVWTSPQIYYQYYHLHFANLPHQWVISPFKNPAKAFNLLFFQGPQNLSAHSQGLLGWSLLAAPFIQLPVRRPKDQEGT